METNETRYSGEYVVIGPPGTGKTTFLKRQVDKIVQSQSIIPINTSPVLVCSLTKAAASEIASRGLPIPERACGTLHSHGYRSMPDRPPLIDFDFIHSWNKSNPAFPLSNVRAFPEPHFAGWSAEQEYVGGHGTACLTVATGLIHSEIPIEEWPIEIRTFYKLYVQMKRAHGKIDYDDMIIHASDNPPFDPKVILVDEAQDVSKLEWSLLRKWGKKAGALIAVGDNRQSLYTWRGADPSFLQNPEIPDENRRVLSQSYRIPKAIHKKAELIARQLTDYQPVAYSPTELEGEIRRNASTYANISPIMDEVRGLLAKGDSVMLAASANYMVNLIADQLNASEDLFSNPWRKHNRKWNHQWEKKYRSNAAGRTTLIGRIESLLAPSRKVHGDDRRMWNKGELWNWVEYISNVGLLVPGAKASIQRAAKANPDEVVTEAEIRGWFFWPSEINTEVLDWFYKTDAGEERTFKEIVDWFTSRLLLRATKLRRDVSVVNRIVTMWDIEGYGAMSKLYIGTFHSFKGSEADHVYVWPDISFSAFRVWSGVSGGPIMRDPIWKQFYVGITRARKSLSIGRPYKKLYVPI